MPGRQGLKEGAEVATAPVIVVIGGAAKTTEPLEAMVLDSGFSLFSGDGEMDLKGGMVSAPDLVLVDVAGSENAELARKQVSDCRAKWHVPVVCLVSPPENLQANQIATLGADDYLLKPVRPDELIARVQLTIQRCADHQSWPVVERRRRSRRAADQEPGNTGSGIVVDSAGKTISIEGRALDLSPKEYELLRLLASNSGQTFSVQEILETVWSKHARASAADVHQYVHLLRSKIERQPGQPRWLVTVRGFGYKLIDPNDA